MPHWRPSARAIALGDQAHLHHELTERLAGPFLDLQRVLQVLVGEICDFFDDLSEWTVSHHNGMLPPGAD